MHSPARSAEARVPQKNPVPKVEVNPLLSQHVAGQGILQRRKMFAETDLGPGAMILHLSSNLRFDLRIKPWHRTYLPMFAFGTLR